MTACGGHSRSVAKGGAPLPIVGGCSQAAMDLAMVHESTSSSWLSPRAPVPQTPMPHKVVPIEAENRPRRIRKEALRVLVVDDNVDSADSLALLLSLDGHDVRVAFDGILALTVAEEFLPRAILLDIGLPGMDGCELARRLRAMPEHKNSLLLAVTGYGQNEDRAKALAAGFDHYLVKPVDPDLVARLLKAIT